MAERNAQLPEPVKILPRFLPGDTEDDKHYKPDPAKPGEGMLCTDTSCEKVSEAAVRELHPHVWKRYQDEIRQQQQGAQSEHLPDVTIGPSKKLRLKEDGAGVPSATMGPSIDFTPRALKPGEKLDLTGPLLNLDALDPSSRQLRLPLRDSAERGMPLMQPGDLEQLLRGRGPLRLGFDTDNSSQFPDVGRRDLFGGDSNRPFGLPSLDTRGLGRDRNDPFGLNRNDQFGRDRNDFFGLGRNNPFNLNGDDPFRLRLDSNRPPFRAVGTNGEIPPEKQAQLEAVMNSPDFQQLPREYQRMFLEQLYRGGNLPLVVEDLQIVDQPPKEKPAATPEKPPEKPVTPEQPTQPAADVPVEKKDGADGQSVADPTKPIDGPKGPDELLEESPESQLTPEEKQIKDAGAYSYENISQAYKDAAKENDGLAIVVLPRAKDVEPKVREEAISNLKKLQDENPNLKILVVDRDKVDASVAGDPNNAKAKEWQSWIDNTYKYNKATEQQVLTSVQSLKPDSTGHPQPEKVISAHLNSNINQELLQNSKLASDATAQYAKQFRFDLKAEDARALTAQIAEARKAAFEITGTDPASIQARQAKYLAALDAAAQARPDLLAQRRKEIDAMTDESMKAEREKQEKEYYELVNAPALLRAELALDMVRHASFMQNDQKRAAMMEAGQDLLKDAFSRAPELANAETNKAYLEAVQKAGVDVSKLGASNASRMSAEEIREKTAAAYKAGDPVRVTEKRTEYTSSVPIDANMRQCVACNRGACYRANGVAQRCGCGNVCQGLCCRPRGRRR